MEHKVEINREDLVFWTEVYERQIDERGYIQNTVIFDRDMFGYGEAISNRDIIQMYLDESIDMEEYEISARLKRCIEAVEEEESTAVF